MNRQEQLRQLRKVISQVSKDDPCAEKIVIKNTSLSCSCSPNESISLASSLVLSLAGNTHVKALILENTEMNSFDAQILASALTRNNHLEQLWIQGGDSEDGDKNPNNRIGSVGASALAAALSKNQSVHSLGLMDNGIDNEGAKALLEMLKENTSLTELCLDGNNISDDNLLWEIDFLIKRNASLNGCSVEDEFDFRVNHRQYSKQNVNIGSKDNILGGKSLSRSKANWSYDDDNSCSDTSLESFSEGSITLGEIDDLSLDNSSVSLLMHSKSKISVPPPPPPPPQRKSRKNNIRINLKRPMKTPQQVLPPPPPPPVRRQVKISRINGNCVRKNVPPPPPPPKLSRHIRSER